MGLLTLGELSGGLGAAKGGFSYISPLFLQKAAAARARLSDEEYHRGDWMHRARPVYAVDVAKPAKQYLKLDKDKLVACLRNCVDTTPGLSGLGQSGECGEAPALGPGELKMCCPEIGWVIYDQYESGYALCERAAALATGETSTTSTSGDYAAHSEARRLANEAELDARRAALEAKRIAIEDRQFQQQVQVTLLKAQLQKAAAARAATPEAIAARQAAAAAAMRQAAAAEEARKAEATKKAITYGAVALAAAKLLALF